MSSNKKSLMDSFFSLGSKVTKDDPVLKAKYDYQLYWAIFLTFCGVALNYFRLFFLTHSISSLLWGIIITVFTWFNYWGLMAFRQTYENMKAVYSKKNQLVEETKYKDENAGFANAFNKGN
jgi:hypothetical protein